MVDQKDGNSLADVLWHSNCARLYAWVGTGRWPAGVHAAGSPKEDAAMIQGKKQMAYFLQLSVYSVRILLPTMGAY